VTRGAVTQRKEPLLYKIFGGESARNIGDYIMWDVLIPAAKSTITDIITNTIEMIFYGEGSSRSTGRHIRRDRTRSFVSYSSLYDNKSKETPTRSRNRSRHRFDDIIIETRGDAEEVLSQLVELIDMYNVASVSDFYDSVGLTSEFTDHKYGWDNLSKAHIYPVRGGYVIDLPKPFPLD
jgi:hypothetical protein